MKRVTKRVVSLLLTICMVASVIVAFPLTASAAVTITDEALFMTYPTYLSNSEMDEGLAKAEAAYYAVINSYSESDEAIAAFMYSVSEGVSLGIKDLLGKAGLTETLYEQHAREAATNYMKSMLANENIIEQTSKTVDKAIRH